MAFARGKSAACAGSATGDVWAVAVISRMVATVQTTAYLALVEAEIAPFGRRAASLFETSRRADDPAAACRGKRLVNRRTFRYQLVAPDYYATLGQVAAPLAMSQHVGLGIKPSRRRISPATSGPEHHGASQTEPTSALRVHVVKLPLQRRSRADRNIRRRGRFAGRLAARSASGDFAAPMSRRSR